MKTSRMNWHWWLLVLAYYAIACLAHLQFSLWLVRQRDTFLGHMAFADWVPGVSLLAGLGLLLWLGTQLRRSPRPWLTSGYWLLWLAAAALIDRFLTFSVNEYAHYPQYAMLAWLLARALDPQRKRWYVGRVLFWATLMGIGDELLQYLWITTSYSDYLDFNDFLTNLVAAAAGLLLYYGAAAGPPDEGQQRPPLLEWRVLAVITLALAAGFQSGRMVLNPAEKIPPGGIAQGADGSYRFYLQRGPDFYGASQDGPHRGRYQVLRPVPALLMMLGVGLLFAGYGRWPRRKGIDLRPSA